MKKILLIIVPVIASLCAFSFVKQFISFDEAGNLIANDPAPEIMCYDVVTVQPKLIDIADLNDQLEKLEKLYAEKKIDESTYKIRKEDLLKKIEQNQ